MVLCVMLTGVLVKAPICRPDTDTLPWLLLRSPWSPPDMSSMLVLVSIKVTAASIGLPITTTVTVPDVAGAQVHSLVSTYLDSSILLLKPHPFSLTVAYF